MEDQQEGAAHEPKYHFTEEILQALRELGELLREIYGQAVSEGYVMEGGRIYRPGDEDKNDGEREQRKPDTQGNPLG